MQSMQGMTRCDWLGLLLSLCIVREGVSGVKRAALETCFHEQTRACLSHDCFFHCSAWPCIVLIAIMLVRWKDKDDCTGESWKENCQIWQQHSGAKVRNNLSWLLPFPHQNIYLKKHAKTKWPICRIISYLPTIKHIYFAMHLHKIG